MIAVVAAGGVVYRNKDDGLEVLLIYRDGVWDLPKGKKEEDETIEECARREVAEETGISLPDIEYFLTKTYHQYQRTGNTYGKTTYWFSMKLPVNEQRFKPQKAEGIEVVQWVKVDEAMQMVGYTNLKDVLQFFCQPILNNANGRY